jgi:hypothetical protein
MLSHCTEPCSIRGVSIPEVDIRDRIGREIPTTFCQGPGGRAVRIVTLVRVYRY